MPVMLSALISENEVRGRVLSKTGCDSCSPRVLAQKVVTCSVKLISLLPYEKGLQQILACSGFRRGRLEGWPGDKAGSSLS